MGPSSLTERTVARHVRAILTKPARHLEEKAGLCAYRQTDDRHVGADPVLRKANDESDCVYFADWQGGSAQEQASWRIRAKSWKRRESNSICARPSLRTVYH